MSRSDDGVELQVKTCNLMRGRQFMKRDTVLNLGTIEFNSFKPYGLAVLHRFTAEFSMA